MEKLFDLFDGFYLMREYNYNLLHIAKLRRDLDAVGKKLYLLANSGCMSYCPGQTFHDNLVAHEDEVGKQGILLDLSLMCAGVIIKKKKITLTF